MKQNERSADSITEGQVDRHNCLDHCFLYSSLHGSDQRGAIPDNLHRDCEFLFWDAVSKNTVIQ